jgi:hypothetical protein
MQLLLKFLALSSVVDIGSAFLPIGTSPHHPSCRTNNKHKHIGKCLILQSATDSSSSSAFEVSSPAPTLDGKRVLPYKIMKAGLKGHKVAAVYALLNTDYKRG